MIDESHAEEKANRLFTRLKTLLSNGKSPKTNEQHKKEMELELQEQRLRMAKEFWKQMDEDTKKKILDE